jgi:hypothetical protein
MMLRQQLLDRQAGFAIKVVVLIRVITPFA